MSVRLGWEGVREGVQLVGEGECVGVISERRRDPASLVMRGCQYLLSLTPLGSSVLEPHLEQHYSENDVMMSSVNTLHS